MNVIKENPWNGNLVIVNMIRRRSVITLEISQIFS